MTLVGVLAAAVAIGVLLGLLGGGGSILTLPVVMYLAGQPPTSAIAMSLFVVAATSAVAVIPHALARQVQWRTAITFGAAGITGAYAGARLAAYVSTTVLLLGFALLMAAAGITMIRGCRRPLRTTAAAPRTTVLFGLGAAVGMVTGAVGAGGGFVVVPALVLAAGLSMPAAVGTSLLIITMQATAGLLGHLHDVTINWPLALTITAAAIGGSLLGARYAGRVPAPLLRTAFGWFLIAMAAFLLVQQAPSAERHALVGTTAGRAALIVAVAALALAAARHINRCRTDIRRPGSDSGRPGRLLVSHREGQQGRPAVSLPPS